MTAHVYIPLGELKAGTHGPIITRSRHSMGYFPDMENPAPIRTDIRCSTAPRTLSMEGPKQSAAPGWDVVAVAYATAPGVVHFEDSDDGSTWATVCKLDIDALIQTGTGCRFAPNAAYYRASWNSPHAAELVIVQSQIVAKVSDAPAPVPTWLEKVKTHVSAFTGITAPPPAQQKPPVMPGQVSIKVSHEFGVIPGSSFDSLEVRLDGATWGQGVAVEEGFQRIAGLRFRATMAREGAALLYCENRTGDPISVPMAVYGLTAS